MKYSVIISVYNAEKTICRLLDSLLNQKPDNCEIIIVNDGSTDNTKKIVVPYCKNYDNVYLINTLNSGVGFARNIGIKKAVGDYVIFFDSDDYISKDFFKTIDKHITNDIDILKYNVEYHGDRIPKNIFNTKKFSTTSGVETLENFIDSHIIFATPWMYVFKKSLFIKNNLYFEPSCIHEDFGLIPRIIGKAKKIKGIDYVGYHYA